MKELKDLKGGRDQSFKSRPEETLRSQNPSRNKKKEVTT